MRLIAYDALRDRGIPYSRMHLRRLIRDHRFPAPIILSTRPDGQPGRIAWPADEIDAWIAARIAARDHRIAA